MKQFTVISSNPNSKGGFVTKVRREVPVKTFVGTKVARTTYYISGPEQLKPDVKVDIDLSQFNVAEYQMINTDTGEPFQGKWLHAKEQ